MNTTNQEEGGFLLPGMAKNYQGVRKEPREQTES